MAFSVLFSMYGAPTGGRESACKFKTLFQDSTLRMDFIFGGNPPAILLMGSHLSPGWAGRRSQLNKPGLQGNGRILMTSPLSGDTLFIHPFSTLYQEWLSLPELSGTPRAFQQSLLLPHPKEEVRISVVLDDMRHNPIATTSFIYSPSDILTRRQLPNSEDSEVRLLHPNPLDSIHSCLNTKFKNPIDVAILPEGYTAEEMERFFAEAETVISEILRYEPFRSFADRFRFRAVAVPSKDSGVSVPKEGKWRDTPFGSHFSTFYADRYLTIPDVNALHDVLEETGVPYEHIIVLANTDEYGGGGIFNLYTIVATGHENFLPAAVHEFGHSFGGLADEYFSDKPGVCNYPLDIEPWEPNITTLTDFPSKWASMLDPSTPVPTPDAANAPLPGVYEGAAYTNKGIYRPAPECRMRNNTYPDFCPVCREALKARILFLTQP